MASVGASVYATWIQVGNVNPYPFETRIHIHLNKHTSHFHTTIGSCLRESTSSNYSSLHTTYRSDSLFHSQEKKSYIHDDNNNNSSHKCDCEVRYAYSRRLLPLPISLTQHAGSLLHTKGIPFISAPIHRNLPNVYRREHSLRAATTLPDRHLNLHKR